MMFFQAGHLPTPLACFLYFDIGFMVWVLLGPVPVFFLRMAVLGGGNGAVFQLVLQRFSRDVGLMTGLVGTAMRI